MKLQKMTKNKNKEPAKKVDVDDDAKQELTKKENDVEKDVDYGDDAKEEPAKKELWTPLSSPSRSRALAAHQGAPPSFKTVQRPKIFTQNVCDEEKKETNTIFI